MSGQHSSFSFAFLDPEGDVSCAMARTYLVMFRKAITFKKWHPRPPLIQCTRCHKFGHLPPHYPLPKDAMQCHFCGGNHRSTEHVAKCASAVGHVTHNICDCPAKCINCGQEGHFARDVVCKARDPFRTPAQVSDESTPPPLLMAKVKLLFVNMRHCNVATHTLLNINSDADVILI
jgi:Zinc knuckle